MDYAHCCPVACWDCVFIIKSIHGQIFKYIFEFKINIFSKPFIFGHSACSMFMQHSVCLKSIGSVFFIWLRAHDFS